MTDEIGSGKIILPEPVMKRPVPLHLKVNRRIVLETQAQQRLPPPPRYSTPAGVVEHARLCLKPPNVFSPKKARGVRRQGQIYERKVHEHFEKLLGETYIPSLWFAFRSVGSDNWRLCQPDALIIDILSRSITICEVKLAHTSDAWWQLKHLYFPVISKVFPRPQWEYRFCEIVRWYDPTTVFPEKPRLVSNPLELEMNELGVHIWKP